MTTPIPEKEPSMEDILRTIRGVIAGKEDSPEAPAIPTLQVAPNNDDVLELTEVVEEDGSIHTLKEKKQEGDILDDIDKATIRDIPSMSAPPTTDTSPLSDEKPVSPVVSEAPAPVEMVSAMPSESPPSVEKKLEEIPSSTPPIDILPSSDRETKNEETLLNDKENISTKAVNQETSSTGEVKKRLISEESAASSMEALQNLVNTIPKTRDHGPHMRAGTTLEDLVIEALKPPLSQWLEVHLSSIVKQLVEKEIKRLMPKDE